MNAIDTLANIANTQLIYADNLRYCLVGSNKIPYTIDGTNAKPNNPNDFVSFSEILDAKDLENYAGVGISIKASKVCAIDVDHCFSEPFNFETADERGKYIYEKFKDLAYIEFSFSGKGMRVLFEQCDIENYVDIYYVKNSVCNIEYYQPSGSARYVTVTGRAIADNSIKSSKDFKNVIIEFLDKYMVRPKNPNANITIERKNEDKTVNELMKIVRIHLFRYISFQTMWFDCRYEYNIGKQYEGQGESEHDYALVCYIYQNVTTNKDLIRQVFEQSEYYKTKDAKHKYKWNYNNYRYYDTIFKRLINSLK